MIRKRFVTINKPYRCVYSYCCACYSFHSFNVKICGVDYIGKIFEIRCLYKTTHYVFNKDNKYKITDSYCQFGYCYKDFCFDMCNNFTFQIYPSCEDSMLKMLVLLIK